MIKPVLACMLTLFAAAMPFPAAGHTIVGAAHVVDGDTLSVGGEKIRLFGIDAPEMHQACDRAGTSWPCGERAAAQLDALIGGRQVVCRTKGRDVYDRNVAVCFAGRDELNQMMVRSGWAVAFRKYSTDYVPSEKQAESDRIGIWGSQFALPEDWRASRTKLTAKQSDASPRTSPKARDGDARFAGKQGCLIKGNRNRRGQWIYHLPGMPYYDATRPEEWFCTEAQAQAAGYRRAIVRP